MPAPLAAQSETRLTGTVIDVTGAVVPGAIIELRRQGGQLLATTTANELGRYTLADVEPGPAVLTASLDGFSLTQADVLVPGGRTITVELTLRPGMFAEDLTVIGSRLAGSEEMLRRTPGSFELLSRDSLTATHVFTTSEALRKVPGVTVRDEEGLGLRPNIGMRGLNPTRSTKVLLLEDGLPTAFAPYGDNASYYHPPIERFDRVEILKGSSQISHGPVTLGGVVNYITPEAPTAPTWSLDLTGGNRDYVNVGGSFGNTWSRTGLFAQAIRKQSDGARENLHSTVTDAMTKVTHAFGPTQQVSVKGNYYREDSQVTYSGLREAEYAADPRQNPFANDVFDGDRVGVSAVYRALLVSRIAFTGTVYTSRFARDWWRQSSNSGQRPNDSADPQCGGMANLNTTCGNEGRLRRYGHTGGEVRARLAFGVVPQETDFGLRIHAEHQNRRQENGDTPLARDGVLMEDNERTTDAVSAYVQHRVLAGAWTVTPGVRIERIAYWRANRLVDVSGSTNLTELVPGIGLAYAAGEGATVFGGVHRGFAPPRAEDIINNVSGGTVDLDPERGWNYEVGTRARVSDRVRVDLTAFRLDYENQIVPASLAGGVGAALTNGGSTLHQGLEMGMDAAWRRIDQRHHDLYARLAYTWLPTARFTGTRFSSVSGFGLVSVSGNRVPYAPERTATWTLGYRHARGLDVQIEAQSVGDQFSDDLNTVSGTADGQRGLIPAWTYWNLAATYQLPRLRGSLFVAVKNLTDATFIVDRSRGILPNHSRLVHVGTSWRF